MWVWPYSAYTGIIKTCSCTVSWWIGLLHIQWTYPPDCYYCQYQCDCNHTTQTCTATKNICTITELHVHVHAHSRGADLICPLTVDLLEFLQIWEGEKFKIRLERVRHKMLFWTPYSHTNWAVNPHIQTTLGMQSSRKPFTQKGESTQINTQVLWELN